MKAQATVTTLSALRLYSREASSLLSEDDVTFFVDERRVVLGAAFFQTPCAMLELEELMRECPSVKESLQETPRGRALYRLLAADA